MTAKAYKSPLGFHFTEEEEAMYQKAIEEAVEFFKTYGRGRAPITDFGIVKDVTRYGFKYYDNPVGSLQVMEEKAVVAEEVEGDWMTPQQIADRLGISAPTVIRLAKKGGVNEKQGGCYVLRLSQIEEIMEEQKVRVRQTSEEPQLTRKEYRSGRWMRPFRMAEKLGIRLHTEKLNAMLQYHKVPYKMHTEECRPFKFYDIDVVTGLPYVKKLISKFSTKQ